jgi:hypothetical protein
MGLMVALTLAAFAAPAVAAPVWRDVDIPAGGGGGAKPQIAFDGQGGLWLSWLQDVPGFGFRQLRAAYRPRNGVLGPAVTVSDYGVTGRDVAVGWTGEATAAWSMDDQSIHASFSPGPGQPFGSEQVLGTPDANSFFGTPTVAVDEFGNAIVGWMRYGKSSAISNGMMISTRTEGGAFGPATELGAAGFGGVADVAVNAKGLAAVVWRGPDNTTRVAVRQPGASAFEPTQALDLVGPGPSVSIGEDGTIVVANSSGAAAGPMGGGGPGLVVRAPGAATFRSAVALPGGGPLITDPDGTVRIVASVQNLETRKAEGKVIVVQGGAVTGVEPIAGATDISQLTSATTYDGHAIAAWTLPQYGSNGYATSVVQPIRFVERAPGAPFGDPQVPPGAPSGFQLASAVGNLGSIALAWQAEPSYQPTIPVRLQVREDPDVAVPPRPTAPRSTPGESEPAPAPAAPTVTGRWVDPRALRATVTCATRCTVGAELRAGGRRLATLRGARLAGGKPQTVVLRTSVRQRRAIARHRHVTAVVTVTAPGVRAVTRRFALTS